MKIEFAEILMHPAMMLALIFGLDLFFGDPVYRLHPVRLIGKLLTGMKTDCAKSDWMVNSAESCWCCFC